MSEPWFDPQTFGMYFGAIGGGVGGSLVGILGGVTGMLAPRGRGRSALTVVWGLFAVAGVASFAAGVVALVTGQPYGIWYPLVLAGFIVGVVERARLKKTNAVSPGDLLLALPSTGLHTNG
jgi:hypothetical protein